MDVQVIGQLIGTLGFPIVACCALFWLIDKNETRHNEEIGGLRKTIDENTKILTSLQELIKQLIYKGE